MTSSAADLINDPVFQLNAVLWLAQPMPGSGDIRPLLYDRGFTVHAIGPLLPLPPDLRLIAQDAGMALQSGVRPDVVLQRQRDQRYALVECKKASFGTESTTSEQARTLLLVAGPRCAESLGLASDQVSGSAACFAVPEDQRDLLQGTLSSLSEEMATAELTCGEFCFMGFLLSESHVCIAVGPTGSRFFSVPQGSHPFLKREPGTDPRPLYFIPYDPDLLPSQAEQAFCKRLLFARLQITVIVAVGHAKPPAELTLRSHDILNDAMFGIYGLWDNPGSRRHMRGLCKLFMRALLEAVEPDVPGAVSFQPQVGWKFAVQDEQHHERVMDALMRFSSETLALEEKPAPDLFDDVEDEGAPGS